MPYTTAPQSAPGVPSSSGTGLLSPSAGAALPASVSLPDACTVTRSTFADDGAGGVAPSTVTLGPYACRMLAEARPAERTEGAAARVTLYRQLWVTLGADIRPTDQLSHGGRVYEVIDSDAGSTGASYVTVWLEWLGQESP